MKLDSDKNVLPPANAVAKVSRRPRCWVRYMAAGATDRPPPTGRLVDGSRITEANID